MTEQKEMDPLPISPNQAAEFLHKHISGRKCSICQSGIFDLPMIADGADKPLVPFQLIAQFTPTLKTLATIPIVCTACGHIEFFALKTVSDKIHGR